MDELNRYNETENSGTTPFQTPVRGADETPGSGYQNAGYHANAAQDKAQQSEPAQENTSYYSANNGGSTPPPNDFGSSPYEQWSGGQKPKKNKKSNKRKFPWKQVAAGVAVAAVAFCGGMLVSGGFGADTSTDDTTEIAGEELPDDSVKLDIKSSGDDVASYAGVYQKVSPSVVAIVVDEIRLGSESSGSGVIMSEDGYIITNNHVVEGGDLFTVVMSDSTTYNAELIGTDEQTDLAVLKIEADGLTAAEFGDSDEIQVGDRAFAIGSPGGVEFQNSFTGGFISAINRDVTINDRVMSLIQTDTAINPGNSGGALINSSGQVIGITSSKLSASSASSASIEGMGFAIPTKTVKEVCDQLIAYGHVTGRPAIGISGYDIDEMRAYYYDLPQGVMVSSVDVASDAYAKGVKSGDIITGVNGKTITCMDEINRIKNDMKAGDTMDLTIYRSGKTITITITLIDQADLSGQSAQSDNTSDSSQYNPYGGYGYTYP